MRSCECGQTTGGCQSMGGVVLDGGPMLTGACWFWGRVFKFQNWPPDPHVIHSSAWPILKFERPTPHASIPLITCQPQLFATLTHATIEWHAAISAYLLSANALLIRITMRHRTILSLLVIAFAAGGFQ